MYIILAHISDMEIFFFPNISIGIAPKNLGPSKNKTVRSLSMETQFIANEQIKSKRHEKQVIKEKCYAVRKILLRRNNIRARDDRHECNHLHICSNHITALQQPTFSYQVCVCVCVCVCVFLAVFMINTAAESKLESRRPCFQHNCFMMNCAW